MADYFTKFSIVVELPSEDAQTYAMELAEDAADHFSREEPLSPDFPARLLQDLEQLNDDVNWGFETDRDDDGIWIHADYGGGGMDVACLFIQHLLRKFNPEGHVAFEWSRDCCSPRQDA